MSLAHRTACLVALLLLLAATTVPAQFLPARSDALDSTVLGQRRALEVWLPEESAKDAARRYETLYVLDGDWNAKIVVETVAFMRSVGYMPPVIVVSVPNFFDDKGVNSRDRDLTPTVVADQPRSGGAAQFTAFLKDELVPYVAAHYPTNGTNLIHGHSYGGLFLVYLLLHEPALFDGYLVLDPALHWDHDALYAPLESGLPATPTAGKAIYIAGRSGHAFEDMGIAGAEAIFKAHAPPALHWQVAAYPGETHDSLKLKATYDALKFAYFGYSDRPAALYPSGGILVRGRPFPVHVDSDRGNVHYTTDGTTPTLASPLADGPITIDDPERTVIRQLSNRGVFDRPLAHTLVSGAALAPVRPYAPVAARWRAAFFPAGSWPNLDAARAYRRAETTDKFDAAAASRPAWAARFERDFAVDQEGYFVFNLESPTPARLRIDARETLAVDGGEGRHQQVFVYPLRRGVHRLRLEFDHPQAAPLPEVAVFADAGDGKPWWKHQRLGFEH